MSFETTTNKTQANGNGSLTIFSYTFLVYEQEHLEVYLSDLTTGVKTLQVLDSDYTVDPAGLGQENGGDITFGTPPTSNERVTMARVVPFTQPTNWINTGRLPLDVQEKSFDLAKMAAQQNDERLDRAIVVPITSTLGGLEIPDPAIAANQGKLIATDEAGLVVVAPADVDLLAVELSAAHALKPMRVNAGGTTIEPYTLTADRLMRLDGDGIPEPHDALTENRLLIGDANGLPADHSAITASRALESDANGLPVASAVTAAELAHLDGVTSGIQAQINAITGGTLTTALTDADQTVVVPLGGARYAITPTTTRTLTLDGAALAAGDVVEIINLAAAQKITLNSDDASPICSFQDGAIRMAANTTDPQAETDWRIVSAEGGASPKFEATMAGNQTISASTPTKIEYGTEVLDVNADYDSASDYRFQPSVPGVYIFTISLRFNNTTDETFTLALYKNGSTYRIGVAAVDDTGGLTNRTAVVVVIAEANGVSDYFEAFADSTTDTSYIASVNTASFFGASRMN